MEVTEQNEEKKEPVGPTLLEIARKRQNEIDGNVYDNPFNEDETDPDDNVYEA
jgi:hypothetical protein